MCALLCILGMVCRCVCGCGGLGAQYLGWFRSMSFAIIEGVVDTLPITLPRFGYLVWKFPVLGYEIPYFTRPSSAQLSPAQPSSAQLSSSKAKQRKDFLFPRSIWIWRLSTPNHPWRAILLSPLMWWCLSARWRIRDEISLVGAIEKRQCRIVGLRQKEVMKQYRDVCGGGGWGGLRESGGWVGARLYSTLPLSVRKSHSKGR